jgi:hypothetical protein
MRELGTKMNAEDITEIDRAGRRCEVCDTGRGWRRFEVIRPAERAPVVLCGACRARFGDDPPIGRKADPASVPDSAAATPDAPSTPEPQAGGKRTGPNQDRLIRALREMPPGTHSTGRIAKAAGLNAAKTRERLRDLERRGEVQQLGKLWSTERPSTEVEAAMDRLEARTSNVRIVREARTRA